jgi:hypothetical protein
MSDKARTREDAAREFAEAIGWRVGDVGATTTRWFGTGTLWGKDQGLVYLPPPDAPLHEHLAFVGRVAEAVGDFEEVQRYDRKDGNGYEWHVCLTSFGECYIATDLSWAALLAGIAAKGSTPGKGT